MKGNDFQWLQPVFFFFFAFFLACGFKKNNYPFLAKMWVVSKIIVTVLNDVKNSVKVWGECLSFPCGRNMN